MVDGEGALGDPDDAKRTQAIENHRKWLEAAKTLGCHSIRVNAQSSGSYAEQLALAADGLARLGEIAEIRIRPERAGRESRRAVEQRRRGWPA